MRLKRNANGNKNFLHLQRMGFDLCMGPHIKMNMCQNLTGGRYDLKMKGIRNLFGHCAQTNALPTAVDTVVLSELTDSLC